MAEVHETGKAVAVLLNDNEESRRMIEHCPAAGRRIVNPIIDWTDRDVWTFIRSRGLAYCGLYDEGFTRLGCIGFPQGGGKKMRADFRRWPKYRENYLRAFAGMLEERAKRGMPTSWRTPEEVMEWWTGPDPVYPLWDEEE